MIQFRFFFVSLKGVLGFNRFFVLLVGILTNQKM